jgi:xanthine dehydrogenase accessory factor
VSRLAVQQRTAQLRSERVPFVHAEVVRAEKPTSAKPGDEAVVFADGTIEGFVGGTCAESTVRAQALALLDSGETLLLRITPEPDDFEAPPGALSVVNHCLSGGTLEIFLEPVIPAPVLVVVGDSPIALALRELAGPLGYVLQEVQTDHPDDDTQAALSGAAAVVVASHGRDEEPLLTAALRGGVRYVGLVASRKRGAAVLASLDVDDGARARVRTPAGLDIGARTPEEVALSILAEIVADRRRLSGNVAVPEQAHPAEEPAVQNATDPVCGMSVAAVDASLHLDHEGERYWFCGTGCLRAFAADPGAYTT